MSFQLLLACSLVLCSCVTNLEDRPRPLYPADWPARDLGHQQPDLSGVYRAVSEEAAPLVYPPGGHPRRWGLFGDRDELMPSPKLGRRVLPWMLAGVFRPNDPAWGEMLRYQQSLTTESGKESAWVRIRQDKDGRIEIRAGIGDVVKFVHELRHEEIGTRGYPSAYTYDWEDGGMLVISGFPEPHEENPNGGIAHANCYFYRARDGSLVMAEEMFHGRGTLKFKKWWRWRRMDGAGSEP